MQTLKSSSIFKSSQFIILQYFSAASYPTVSNPPLFNYLVKNLNFSETQAISISSRYCNVKHLENIQHVVSFFRSLGFSNAQIASSAVPSPQILFANVEKNLRPKIKYFQDLGLVEPHIGMFFSRNSVLLNHSLDNKLIPSIQLFKKVLGNNNEQLFKVLGKYNGHIFRGRVIKLSRNIEYLESCGIVGSQLSMLLRRQPGIFTKRESALRELVSRALGMGLSTDSKMLAHAIHTLSDLSEQTFKKKWELLRSFGFSDNDCRTMFSKAPRIFTLSDEKMKLRIEFFINVAKIDKNVLAYSPSYLSYSLEGRVIPRYRVFQIIKSKKLLKKDLSFLCFVARTETDFLEFISRFRNDMDELLVAYKTKLLPKSSLEQEEEEEEEEEDTV